MPYLLDKSKQNQYAALKLFDTEKKYAPSVHCAYYSCIQMMIHVLIAKGGKTEAQIDSDTQNQSSHKYFIRETENLLKQKSPAEVLKFSAIKNLQQFRVRSDYKNKEITHDNCDEAIKIADKINGILTKTFGIV